MGVARWALIGMLVVACGMPESWRTARPRQANRQLSHPGTPRLAAGDIPEGSPRLPEDLVNAPHIDELPEGEPGLVVFVVMDTVRADRMSACGYEHPTTPAITKLVELGASLTCEAYAPATWTLPSHATYFTGADVEVHGMLRKGLALPENLPTLAEAFAGRGYQTMLMSANPLLRKTTGLTRGFHRVQVAPGLVSAFRGAGLVKLLRYELAQIDPTRPLFLVVNIIDAHEPYPKIPEGLAWASAQPAIYAHNPASDAPQAYDRYTRGEMSEAERTSWLSDVSDGYDMGVLVASTTFGSVLQLLERHGLGKRGVRLVMTSDHGENLGEHGTLWRDGPPWEQVARVPLLYWESPPKPAKLELPDRISASVVHPLLLTGKLPDPLPEVRSGWMHDGTKPRTANSIAIWPGGSRKLWWRQGGTGVVDLSTDPLEADLKPATPEEEARLQAVAKAFLEAKARGQALPTQPKVEQMLEQAGNVE